MPKHPSHVTRISDASSFDEICTRCGATDRLGSWGRLAEPCSNPDLATKVGVLEAKRITQREQLRTRIQTATTIDELKSIMLDLYPEISRP